MSLDRNRQFDLLAFAGAMKAEGRHRRLVGVIEKAVSVCSAHEDLRAAIEHLTALREITRASEEKEGRSKWVPACAHALTAHAIILYCRATQTPSNTVDFLLLVEAVSSIAVEEARERMNEVLVAVADVGSGDGSLKSIIETYRFDPDSFFVAPGAQEHIWDQFGDDGIATLTTATVAPFYDRDEYPD